MIIDLFKRSIKWFIPMAFKKDHATHAPAIECARVKTSRKVMLLAGMMRELMDR
jgi:hypothetical protein